MRRRELIGALVAAPFVLPCFGCAQDPTSAVMIDGGPYVPTPAAVVDEMLKLAEVRRDDTVYDLGSGDGRLVIEAARQHGARGVGIEREARLVDLARAKAVQEKVADRVRFIQEDLFDTDLRGATVVTLYLLPRLLVQLLPKLLRELPAGARIVSHDYPLNPWPADKSVILDVEEKGYTHGSSRTELFLYRMPTESGSRGSR